MNLVSVAEMKAVEQAADAAGWTYAMMMESAGRGLAEVVMRRAQGWSAERRVVGLVGSGNNGGDTLIALEHLARAGWTAHAGLLRPRPGDALLERLAAAGGTWSAPEETARLDLALDGAVVVLDGVLGTGIQLPLRPELAQALGRVRQRLPSRQRKTSLPGGERGCWVVAVDCPSGVDCDSGAAAPECIAADVTVCMAAVKVGLTAFPAFELAGELETVSIGAPEELPAWQALRRRVADADWVREALPERRMTAHKGTFGTALVVAGSINYCGAAFLAGKAAYRAGAGLVTLGVSEAIQAILAGQLPEATWVLLPHEDGVLSAAAEGVLRRHLKRVSALLLGPGWGVEATTGRFLARLLETGAAGGSGMGFLPGAARAAGDQLPALVVDADGLKLLAQIPRWSERLPKPAVLTPHPGEMAVLSGLSVAEIQADRLALAECFAREWGHVLVLKGAVTVVASPEGETAVIPVATAALARAGTGDVLAGVITGLRAQGMSAFAAAAAGAWIHAQAGLAAARAHGSTVSVLAGDVLDGLVRVFADLAN